jgi:hypothetical protein
MGNEFVEFVEFVGFVELKTYSGVESRESKTMKEKQVVKWFSRMIRELKTDRQKLL